MTNSEPKLHAVLTGDLVKSSQLDTGQLESVRNCLLSAVDTIAGWHHRLVRGNAEFFRGDSWQLLLTDPGQALRAAVFLRAALRAQNLATTRVAIALGRVDKVEEERISLSTGEAFTLSGQTLDSMKKPTQMAIELQPNLVLPAPWIKTVVELCDVIVSQWTARQAEIVQIRLAADELTYEEIAESLHPTVSKQAVSKAISGANLPAVEAAIQCFEQTEWQKIRQ